MYRLLICLLLPLLFSCQISKTIAENATKFPLVNSEQTAAIFYEKSDATLVEKAAQLFAQDIQLVTDKSVEIVTDFAELKGNVVIIGTLGQSKIIDQLAQKYPELNQIKGDWERYIIKEVTHRFPNIDKALIIVGSDRRGAAYGVFNLSEEIGVSPWYWWADVPVQKKAELVLKKEMYVSKTPSVKYRGIFINDEAPALTNWAAEKFGGFNHQFYEKVFELILRNKGNYLWPAMWQPAAFVVDDPKNMPLADDYGIVISTTHHEPMMRAHDEWRRFKGGKWNYSTNKEKLQTFWRGGIERMGDYETVVTLGMRGDGDEAMTENTAVDLLQNIITDQRNIIADVTKKPASETPQVWAIYKEVQDYYDEGMRVDDDIMILFCDDNWGNVRILPKKEERDYKGGFGMYYHFDFVGGPTSYRWLNVTQIERVWEQMNLSYNWGVKDLWLVNVGDIKPMELPISFFLDFAYDTEGIQAKDLPNYYVKWATQQFGTTHAAEIAEILSLYTKYNARRTPEMLAPTTYSLTNYREADRIVEDYKSLLEKANQLYQQIPTTQQSAFYQLVLSPVALCSNLNEMYVAAGKNQLYATQGRASANHYADKVKEYFLKDAALTRYYQEDLAQGKWNHIMSQTHIGYTYWNNPPANKMPAVSYIQTPPAAQLGYFVEYGKNRNRWTNLSSKSFATFDPINQQSYYVEIFNKGEKPLSYSVTAKEDWIKLSAKSGTIQFDEKVYVSIDWEKAPKGTATGEIEIAGAGRKYALKVPIQNDSPQTVGFVENNGVIAINASNYSKANHTKDIKWTLVPNLGRTSSAMVVEPMNAERQIPNENAPSLEYHFTTFAESDLIVHTYLSPTLNYQKKEGLKYAIAIDGETPQIINIHEGETKPDWTYPKWWNQSVTDHIKIKESTHKQLKSGQHPLKIWMVDPGLVFQKFVIDAGGLMPSYLGPPESVHIEK